LLPHGAALSVLRDVQYFDHQGIAGGVTSLLVWSGLGLLLLTIGAMRPPRNAETGPITGTGTEIPERTAF
jgi:hypothetical protein